MSTLLASRKYRYIVASAVNFAFGYSIIVILHGLMHPRLNMIFVGILANILGILFSFATYKVFVFRTKGHWVAECLKCYVVYSGAAVINIAILWLLIDILGISVWSGSLIAVFFCFAFSYASHTRFTFKPRKEP